MEEFKVGDKVILSEYYQLQYSGTWVEKHKNPAEVVYVKYKKVPLSNLDKDDKVLYRSKMGIKEVYDLYELGIKFSDNEIYIVSNLGVMKVL